MNDAIDKLHRVSASFIRLSVYVGILASLLILGTVNNNAFACFINSQPALSSTQFGARVGLGNAAATCSSTPPVSDTAFIDTGGGVASGTVTSDVRTMTFDMDWSGGSSGTSWGGTAFIYIPDLIFSDLNNQAATSAQINSGELFIDYTFISSVNDADGLANGTRTAYFSDAGGNKFFETAFTGFQFGAGTQTFSDAMNPIFNNPESLPLNTPIGLYVQFTADHSAGGGLATSTDATAILGGSPLFVLPAGLTVNSASLGLVNNSFAVPLPTALWLFISGLLALAGITRSR